MPRKTETLLLSFLVVTLIAVVAGDQAKASLTSGFCKKDLVLRDHLDPLSELPQGRGFSDSGRLRVGPSALRIYPPRERLVRVGTDRFAARGGLEGSARPSRPLRWQVESRLERVDRTGRHSRLVRSKKQFIPTVGKFERRDFGFPASVEPGLYRLTVEIQNAQGVEIDRYEEYYRAMKPRFDLRLNTDFTELGAGEVGYMRIDNWGTVPAAYGVGYWIWDAQGEEVPVEAIFPAILLGVKPGHASQCLSFKAPQGLAPGRYTIGTEVDDYISGRWRWLFRPVAIAAP